MQPSVGVVCFHFMVADGSGGSRSAGTGRENSLLFCPTAGVPSLQEPRASPRRLAVVRYHQEV